MPHSGRAPCWRPRIGGDNEVPYHQVMLGTTTMDAFAACPRIDETPLGGGGCGMEVLA